MSWGPLQPARIAFSDAAAPAAPHVDDADHARTGADDQAHQAHQRHQAHHALVSASGLPGRWAGLDRFVVLETGFGLGHNFLATWAAWQQDSWRCDRLWYVAVEKHPPQRADLARAPAASPHPALAAALLGAWPPLTPDMHLLDLDGGRVRLLLAFGDIAQVLPDLVLQADAFYLDGVAPDRNPAMWDARLLRTLARLAAPQATAATWSVAGALRQGLAAAGFVVDQAPGDGGQRQMTVARFAPRFTPHPPPPGRAPLPAMASTRTRAEPAPPQPARHAAASVPHRMPGAVRVAVVGAGLAGAAMAAVLAARRLDVQVFERHGGPAAETSGNAGGLFHGVVHAQDGPHARWLRAAALHAERVLRPMLEGGTVPGKVCGLLRGEQQMAPAAMQRLLHVAALPADYLQAVPHTDRAAWFYPGGGWVSPAALAAHWLQRPGLRTRFGTAVSQLRRTPDGWQLLDAAGGVLADADAVVLCNAADAQRLAPGAAWPLQRLRGQTTVLPAGLPGAPQLPHPQADAGYALTLDDGRLLCGATSQAGDDDPALRAADHAANLATLQRLTGWSPPPGAPLDGRVGWRLTADDRLPLLGPVPDSTDPAVVHGAGLLTQPRHVPRLPGLWVMTALGSRGITQAPLAAEVLASWLTGEPVPLPAALLDAVDAARFVSRGVRRGG